MFRLKRGVVWYAIALLVGGIALLGTYRYLRAHRFVSDPALVHELQARPLPPPERTAGRPGEWPGWRGPLRDGICAETGLLTDWPESGPKVVWEAPVGAGYSSMAVANGRLYTMFRLGDEEQLVCLDAATGSSVWKYAYPIAYSNEYGGGPRATPAVSGNRVYAVGATGIFSCVDAQSGKKIWDHDLLGELHAPAPGWGVVGSPLLDGKLVFTMPGGPNGNSIAAFDKDDGHLVWHCGDDPAGYSSPILTQAAGVRQLLCFTGNALVSVNPETGEIFWRYPWETSHKVNCATPLVRGDYVFISSGYGKGCALLKIAADGGKLGVSRVYEANHFCDHHSGSVLWGEHIYGFDEGRLKCLDFRTGEALWSEKGFGQGTLVAADGHLFILSERGEVAVVEASPEGLRKKASFKFSSQRCWTVPVIAAGRLYVRDEKRMVCYSLKGE